VTKPDLEQNPALVAVSFEFRYPVVDTISLRSPQLEVLQSELHVQRVSSGPFLGIGFGGRSQAL
jgi:hypothetical protein